ncbi:MAG TPA: response regulator [Candidatus Saccharimonadia bacterium]|nr:response regulator [Candidatus Saccharimonadia bacterium]
MTKRYIILVEDDYSLAEGLQLILQDEGYEVLVLSDGDEVEKQLAIHKPDLMIIDYRLPGRDGASITRAIRQQKNTARLPIIITSAGQRNFEMLAKQAGAMAFLGKPFEIDELLSLVRKQLSLNT